MVAASHVIYNFAYGFIIMSVIGHLMLVLASKNTRFGVIFGKDKVFAPYEEPLSSDRHKGPPTPSQALPAIR